MGLWNLETSSVCLLKYAGEVVIQLDVWLLSNTVNVSIKS